MDPHWRDLEPGEQLLFNELQPSVRHIHGNLGPCPDVDLLLAAREGTLPQDAAAGLVHHCEHCPFCRALARDLDLAGLTAPTAAEADRIRRRVFAEGEKARTPDKPIFRLWTWLPALAAAVALVLISSAIWHQLNIRLWPQIASLELDAPSLPPPSVSLPLVKPPVKLPATLVMTWRGEANRADSELLTAFGQAFPLYREGKYREAAGLLESLARTHPESAEAHYYLGVCRLFFNDNRGAAAALVRARLLAKGEMLQDASWYLAIASARAGQPGLALAELESLCRPTGAYGKLACAALSDYALRR